jgi:hypothetical protein
LRIAAPDTFIRGWHRLGCQPCAVRHRYGAQVALLRCPIPRDGAFIISERVGGQEAINSTVTIGPCGRSLRGNYLAI